MRTKVLNTYAIEVLRYTNEEILNRFEDVVINLKKRVQERIMK
ncbi:MAG: hypothetical protein IPL26_25255 [Leptospiraceae bacterium]|nr:hypothetical protein [Leptospiraceae bacterium]